MINNRQNGRRRGRGGQQVRNGQSGAPDRGNRLDNRARGNAAQLLEKYKTLARDAQMQGDRVNTEYYLQFADHYFRVLSESRSRFEEQQQRRPRDEFGDEDGNQSRGYQADDGGDDGWDDGDGDRIDGPNDFRPAEPRQAEMRQPDPRQSEYRRPEPRQAEPRANENRANENRGNENRANENRANEARGNDMRANDARSSEPRAQEPRGDEARQPDPRSDQPPQRAMRPRRDRRDDRQPIAPPVDAVGDGGEREAPRPAGRTRSASANAAGLAAPANGNAAGPIGAAANGYERVPELPSEESQPARIAIELPPSISGSGEVAASGGDAEPEAAPKRRRTRRPRAEGAPADA